MKIDPLHNRDFLAGMLFLAIGVFTLVLADDYVMGWAERMGPGYFPTVIAGLLCLFGGYILVRGIFSGGRVAAPWAWKPPALITLSIVLFGFLMEHYGLVPALAAVIFVSALASHEFRFGETLVLTALMGVFVIGVFFYGLKLPYPMFGW